MSSNSLAFELGVMYGFAIGISFEQRKPAKIMPAGRYPEDALILEYINKRTKVYTDDVLGFLNWNNNRSGQITVGHAMRRLGWDRRRDSERRWYYVRGVRALAHQG